MQDVVAELRVGVKDLAAEDRAGWAPLALSDRVRDLVGLNEAKPVELVRGVASWDRATAWAEDGAVTAVGWLKANSLSPGRRRPGWSAWPGSTPSTVAWLPPLTAET